MAVSEIHYTGRIAPPQMKPPVLDIQVSITLPAFTVELDWKTESRVCGLFGPSGSGKTTLMEAVAGLRPSARGRVAIQGSTLADTGRGVFVPAERRGIGYVPQDHLLMPHLDVRGNIALGRRRALLAGRRFDRDLEEAAEVLGLESLLGRSIETLSGGERQRVALARALCSGPRLLLMDEPLASLDDVLRQRILPFLLRIRDHYDLPILIVSHSPIELQALCDEVVAIAHGRMVTRGTPTDVFTRENLYPAEAGMSFENMIPAAIHGHSEHTTELRLGNNADGPLVLIPRSNQISGSRVLLGLPAHEIILATRRPEALSARNCLPGEILSLQEIHSRVLVKVSMEPFLDAPVICEATQEAVHALRIRAGQEIFLVIKSTAFKLYG